MSSTKSSIKPEETALVKSQLSKTLAETDSEISANIELIAPTDSRGRTSSSNRNIINRIYRKIGQTRLEVDRYFDRVRNIE